LAVFESSGDAASLDQAIDLGQDALKDADGTTAAAVATNLSNALLSRYELRGWRSDADAAVAASTRSVVHTPSASPFLPGRLSNRCNALRASAAADGDASALDDAITAGRQSVEHPHLRDPEIAGYWSNLAVALSDRFDIAGDAADLDESIAALHNAARLVASDHPSALLYRTNLAVALRQRFDHSGPRADIDEAVTLLTDAAATVPPSHSHAAAVWLSLGNALHSRYLTVGERTDYLAAQKAWDHAAESLANAGTRLIAAESLAVSAADTGDWPRAAMAFRRAIGLVPIVAWHGLDRRGREEALSNLSPLAGSACAAAIAADDYDSALENIEAGRSVLWKQVLDLRRDFTAVEAHDRALADRLRQLSRLLDAPDPVLGATRQQDPPRARTDAR
jgi:tetratricopeptide (TPR) repeat protein